MSSENWHFCYAGDMQPGSPRSYRYRPAFMENWTTAKQQIKEMNPELLLIGGDITRDGTHHQWELTGMRAEFDDIGVPYHAVPGNMDVGNKHTSVEGPHENTRDTEIGITSDNLNRYEEVFGSAWWTFDHRNVRFSGLCDMLLGSGLPEERRMIEWMEEQKQRPKVAHHIWIMHYALFVDDAQEPEFDIRNPDQYTAWYFTVDYAHRDSVMSLFRETDTTRVITGHIHCQQEYRAHGITFDLAPALAFPQWVDRWPDGNPQLGFLRYDVDGTGVHKTFVPLRRVSERKDGYGPGGHPLPEHRDYSLAWEKPEGNPRA